MIFSHVQELTEAYKIFLKGTANVQQSCSGNLLERIPL